MLDAMCRRPRGDPSDVCRPPFCALRHTKAFTLLRQKRSWTLILFKQSLQTHTKMLRRAGDYAADLSAETSSAQGSLSTPLVQYYHGIVAQWSPLSPNHQSYPLSSPNSPYDPYISLVQPLRILGGFQFLCHHCYILPTFV